MNLILCLNHSRWAYVRIAVICITEIELTICTEDVDSPLGDY